MLKRRSSFRAAPRHVHWQKTADQDWNNWVWQQRQRVRGLQDLSQLLELSDDEKCGIAFCEHDFRMSISPYYLSLMDRQNPQCPIRLQAIPTLNESINSSYDLEDPLSEEEFSPVANLTHKYPDRALLYTTHNCAVYCRHCTRKRKVSQPASAVSREALKSAFDYIKREPKIRDIVISGGDPLSNSNSRLRFIFENLLEIDHVEMIRLGTRNLVTLPQRVDEGLLDIISMAKPVFINTHFNHPKECTKEAYEACMKLLQAGAVIGNQMVLLKGINDNLETVKELNHKLLMMGIRPYYIYQCDLARGISHFATPLEKGLEIIQGLQGWTSGLALPHFVIDAPEGGGKIAVSPSSIVDSDDEFYWLRNYEGKIYKYPKLTIRRIDHEKRATAPHI